jgi:hypothetical protein
MSEIVGNDFHMLFERSDELVEAIQTTAFDFGDPILNGSSCDFLGLFRKGEDFKWEHSLL